MISLIFDGILPFIIISIMNTLIIRAIRQRHREFDAFNTENPGGQSRSTESGKINKINRKKIARSFADLTNDVQGLLFCRNKIWANLKTCLFSGDKSAQENRQLTLTLVLVCSSFLLLATPLYFLLVVYSFVDNKASPERFATFQLIKTIFEQVNI